MLIAHPTLTEKGKSNPPRSKDRKIADVCLVLEGTYPYVSGGVSSWVHTIIEGMPEISFSLFVILPDNKPRKFRFKVPDNVIELNVLYLSHGGYNQKALFSGPKNADYLKEIEKFHSVISRNNTENKEDPSHSELGAAITKVSDIFNQQNWNIPDRLHSKHTWELLQKNYKEKRDEISFVDYFQTWKALHTSIFAIMNSYIPKCKVFHTISTGYAGFVGAKGSAQYNVPLILTEHGIYNKERKIDIARSTWIYEEDRELFRAQTGVETFKKFWIHAFRIMSQICYEASNEIITLYTGNQRFQLEDGAEAEKMKIIPNGIHYSLLSKLEKPKKEKKIIGFVGRVVPIKDVKTFLRAVAIVFRSNDTAEAWLMGPTDENKEYYQECVQLVEFLKIKDRVKFVGMVNLIDYYPKLDVLVLTSISEAQPLVILEAQALEIPAISTDVGGCRELLEGIPGEDQKAGRSGLITGLANPMNTASAILHIFNSPEEAREMGKVGRERVEKYYDLPKLIQRYRDLYQLHMASKSDS